MLRVLMACGAGFLGSPCGNSRKAKACTRRQDENRIFRVESCLVLSERARHLLSRIAEGAGAIKSRLRFLQARRHRPAAAQRYSRLEVDEGADLSGDCRWPSARSRGGDPLRPSGEGKLRLGLR